ncbi:hypothetical protein KAR10_03965 [bacterium]|nr:hypothetical protein [bacterium]
MSQQFLKVTLSAAFLLFFSFSATAERLQCFAVQKAVIYGEEIQVPEEVKQHYLSQGQEYLRGYLKNKMLGVVASKWLPVDWHKLQTLAAVELNDFCKDAYNLPLRAQVRVYAEEDIKQYYNCGRFWPVEIEIDSSYRLMPFFKLEAKLEAPFNDLLRFQIGSEIQWSEVITSHLQYRLCNAGRSYDGMNIWWGLNIMDWKVSLNHDLTPEFHQIHRISLAKKF